MKIRNVVAGTLIAAFAIASPILAHDPDKEGKNIERIVIIEKGGKDHKKSEVREFRMHRLGEGPDRHMMIADCGGDKTEIDETTGKEKTKIVLCGKGGGSSAERIKHLEEVRTKLAASDHLSAEHRAKVEAALQKAIEQLQAAN